MATDDSECIHGLGPVSACTICNGREARERAASDKVIARFPARYTSRLWCGHETDLGETIVRMADDRYLCESCAP